MVNNEHPFSYLGETKKGPENWGNLNTNWQTCETGKFQSPIDLLDDKVEVLSRLGELKRTYKPAPAVIRNRGHDIMVAWTGDAGGVIINGTEYKLVQCHWHTPSEHTVEGRSLKMELHMVHNNSQGQIAVVGILYELGRPDTFLEKFLPNLKSDSEEGIDLGVVNPWDIKFGSRKYFRYVGSLTVPPCTEGVLWTVLKKVRTASREQITALRDAVHDDFEDNARPTQNWDGRIVYKYRPRSL
ncbi:hypothetical protein Pfo_003161 [Paulownia fortunei]|nr:hypothetical protein Pfo_003161 [Paulownia fortunei]